MKPGLEGTKLIRDTNVCSLCNERWVPRWGERCKPCKARYPDAPRRGVRGEIPTFTEDAEPRAVPVPSSIQDSRRRGGRATAARREAERAPVEPEPAPRMEEVRVVEYDEATKHFRITVNGQVEAEGTYDPRTGQLSLLEVV